MKSGSISATGHRNASPDGDACPMHQNLIAPGIPESPAAPQNLPPTIQYQQQVADDNCRTCKIVTSGTCHDGCTKQGKSTNFEVS